MKLILMTTPHFFVEEHAILSALFDEGLDCLHLRKPESEPVLCERLLSLLSDDHRKRIVAHDHFYLKNEYGLRGIHLSQRNPEPPKGYRGPISLSCHTAEEVAAHKKKCDYMLLSPIFDSISKEGYHSNFPPATLRELARRGVVDRKVMAMGGVDLDTLPALHDYGFGGAVVLGAVWNHFDPFRSDDFKELVTHFRKLRRAAGR